MPGMLPGSDPSWELHYGLLILGRGDLCEDTYCPSTLDQMLGFRFLCPEGIATIEALKEHLLKLHPGCVARAERAIELHRQSSHIDPYEWSIEHWGTDANSGSVAIVEDSPGRLECRFDTTGGVPVPIFKKLAAEYPGLPIEVAALDESGFGAFIGVTGDGDFCGTYGEPADGLYELVCGHPPYHEDEEEDAADIAAAMRQRPGLACWTPSPSQPARGGRGRTA